MNALLRQWTLGLATALAVQFLIIVPATTVDPHDIAMVSQTSLDAGSESDITLLAEESEGAAYPENMGEGVELSEGAGAEVEAREELADALLDGQVGAPANVRLFNTLFSSSNVHTDSRSGSILGAAADALPLKDEQERLLPILKKAEDANLVPKIQDVSVQGMRNSVAKAHEATKQSEAVVKSAAKELAKGKRRRQKRKTAASVAEIEDKNLHRQLQNVTDEIDASSSMEKRMKKELSPGQKVLVNEEFMGSTPNDWAAATVDMDQLPGGIERAVPVELEKQNNCISAKDTATKGRVWYWQAPKHSPNEQMWLGNMQEALAGKLSFELNQSPPGMNEAIPSEGASQAISKKLQQYETFADVILHGGSGQRSKWTLGFYFNRYGLTRKQPSSSTWTRYEVPLSPVAGDPTLGAPWVVKTNAFDMDASESHFENVLGNLDTILIRGRYQTGTETTKIRNIFITGCPSRCKNGGEVVRDRCVCKCKIGFSGDACETRTQFDFESLSPEGQGTSKCLTVCRPKLKATRFGQKTYLDCSEKHNSYYYLSAQPIIMMVPCSGEANQLWHYDGDIKHQAATYRSAALPGYCLAQASEAALQGMRTIGFELTSAPLSVAICSKENPQTMWSQSIVRTAPEGVFRFATSVVSDNNKAAKCIVPHQAWDRGCAEEQCTLEGRDEEVRQAVLEDCDSSSRINMFNFGASEYFEQRKQKSSGEMVASSFAQHPKYTREMTVKMKEAEIVRAQKKLKGVGSGGGGNTTEVRKAQLEKEKEVKRTKELDFKNADGQERKVKFGKTQAAQDEADTERAVKVNQTQAESKAADNVEIAQIRSRIMLLERRIGTGGAGSAEGSAVNTESFDQRQVTQAEIDELNDKLGVLQARVGAGGSGSGSGFGSDSVQRMIESVQSTTDTTTLDFDDLLDKY